MCSRYELKADTKDISRHFGLADLPLHFTQGEIRPTDAVLTVTFDRFATLRHWGPPAPWDGKPLINARSETLLEKATFRPMLSGRCAIPASAYFEWRKAEDGSKRKNRIHPKSGLLFAFAGLMNDNHATILTQAPVPAIRHIHGRMPVILTDAGLDDWLNPDLPIADALTAVHSTLGPLAFDEEQPPQADLFA